MLKAAIRTIAGAAGYEIHRKRPRKTDYIDAAQTIAAANAAGLSVSQYVAKLWNREGVVERFFDMLESLGVDPGLDATVVEIGAGTGRCVEQAVNRWKPARFEVYELDKGWSDYLADTYPVIAHEADGETLAQTADASADLVSAYGVFVYLPILTSIRYWQEIARVTKPGGWAVFDVMSEACFSDPAVVGWQAAGETFPAMVSRSFLADFFAARGFDVVGSFVRPYNVGLSEVFAFRRA